MQCQNFLAVAPLWLEGQRSAEARAHLDACAACRAYIAELEAIIAAARELEAETPEPPERIWTALRAQLEEEGMIQDAAAEPVGLAKLWSGWTRGFAAIFRRPALAAAYAAIVIAAVILSGWPGTATLEWSALPQGEISVTKVRRDLESGQLRAASGIASRNPEVAASYRANLEVVDKFIRMCEKTVREQPGNQLAREYLLSAYQQKAELLNNILEREAGD